MRIRGERILRGARKVQGMGGGYSVGITLHPDAVEALGVSDGKAHYLRQSILPDGTVRLTRCEKPKRVRRSLP